MHEECPLDESGAERQDVNSDGRVDRTIVREGGVERCRALDLNFDGAIDAWVYLDASGKVRRRESDYDRDGRVDEIAIYKQGVLAERQRATSLLGKLDTWQFYEAGKVTRAERDSNGDDVVDQWWEYTPGREGNCPLIHSDVDGDGRPDPGATVDVCGEQHVPVARDGARPPGAPGLEGGDVPTEVEPAQPPTEEAAPAQPPQNNGVAPATPGGGKAP